MFREFLFRRFDITLPGSLEVEERKDKVYIYHSRLKEVNFQKLQKKGMLGGKLNSLFGIKPTLNFVLTFGHLANKNYLIMTYPEIERLYHLEVFEKSWSNLEEGLVIIKDNAARPVCLCHLSQIRLRPLIPKDRILSQLP